MSSIKTYSALLVIIFLASGCAQLSSFQTGRTMEEDLVEFGVGVEAFNVDETEDTGSLGFGIVPNLRLWGRTAITDNLEMGLSISSGLNAKIDGRYQLIGNKMSTIAGAVGLGYEYQFVGEGNNTFVHRAHLPIYLSYHLGQYNAVYATPRYTFQYVSDDTDTHFIGTSLGYQHVFSGGLILGAEISYFAPLQDGSVDSHLFLAGTALKYRFFR